MAVTVELDRFRVKAGKSSIVDEWLAFLTDHMEDTLLTLEGEKMYVETIFRKVLDGQEYLYWYSVQGQGGSDVEESDSYIDKKHLEYWKECIDPSFTCDSLKTEVVMISKPVQETIDRLERQ